MLKEQIWHHPQQKRILHEKNTPSLTLFVKIAEVLDIHKSDRERYIKFMYGIDIKRLNLTYIKAKLNFSTLDICEKLNVKAKDVRSIEAGKANLVKLVDINKLKDMVNCDKELTDIVSIHYNRKELVN